MSLGFVLMSLITISREQFLDRYEKRKTKIMIQTAFIAWDKFLRHIHSEEADIVQKMRDDQREALRILDHMVQVWKKSKSLATIKSYFQYTKAWLKFNDVRLDDDRIKEYVRFPKPIKYRTRGIDKDIIKLLIDNSNPFYRALFIVLASTGIRVDGVLHMTPSWIDFNSRPAKVTVPGRYAKAGVEYITFLTPEAERKIRDMIKQRKLNDDEVIFDRSYATFALYMSKLRKKLNLLEKEPNGKFYVVRIHKYRSFTLNRLSRSVGSEFAHAVLGHGESVGKYFHDGMSDEEAGQDFLKGAYAVTMDESTELKSENERLRDKVNDIDDLKKQMQMLKAALYIEKQKTTK